MIMILENVVYTPLCILMKFDSFAKRQELLDFMNAIINLILIYDIY